MFNNKLSKFLIPFLFLSLSAFTLTSCDKVKERLDPEKERTVNVGNADKPNPDSIITYGVTDYVNLPEELRIPSVYQNNYINNLNSYNIISTVYKNFLYNFSDLGKTEKAQNFLNELYNSLDDVKSVPSSEIVIFYIDTLRNLQNYISKGLNSTVYSAGIDKNQRISELSETNKIQFLTNITDNLDTITDNFFLVNQFLTNNNLNLSLHEYTEEYERFQNIKRELKNQNSALIQYDSTCINLPVAGDIINCLQTKYTIEFAALDTQLLSTFNYYLLSDHVDNQDKLIVQSNLDKLKEAFEHVVEKNHYQFDQDLTKLNKANNK